MASASSCGGNIFLHDIGREITERKLLFLRAVDKSHLSIQCNSDRCTNYKPSWRDNFLSSHVTGYDQHKEAMVLPLNMTALCQAAEHQGAGTDRVDRQSSKGNQYANILPFFISSSVLINTNKNNLCREAKHCCMSQDIQIYQVMLVWLEKLLCGQLESGNNGSSWRIII